MSEIYDEPEKEETTKRPRFFKTMIWIGNEMIDVIPIRSIKKISKFNICDEVDEGGMIFGILINGNVFEENPIKDKEVWWNTEEQRNEELELFQARLAGLGGVIIGNQSY